MSQYLEFYGTLPEAPVTLARVLSESFHLKGVDGKLLRLSSGDRTSGVNRDPSDCERQERETNHL